MKIKVFIADDDNILIDGIAKFFRESTTFEYIDRGNDPQECLEKLASNISDVDIILMDVKFTDHEMDGLELAREIRKRYPGKEPRIAFMTIGDRAIADASKGFHGIIPKNQGITELMTMLENIYHQGTVYPPPPANQQLFIDKLTPWQRKIFCLLLTGNSIEEVAVTLNVTAHAIFSNQRIILSKIQQLGLNVKQINSPKLKKLAKKHNLCN